MARWSVCIAALLTACGTTPPASDDAASSSTTALPVCEDEGWQLDGGGADGAEDTGLGMGDDMPLPLTILQVQQGEAPSTRRVAIRGAVVVTPLATSEIRGFELFVQAPAGGPYSGLRVLSTALTPEVAPVPGDRVDLVGEVIAHEGFYALELDTAADVSVVGQGSLPAPTTVAVDDLVPGSSRARPYEGVVVRVEDTRVTDAAPCTGEFVLDHVVRVDDRFVPGLLVAPAEGEPVSSVQGVFTWASGTYELAPPELADVR